MKSYLDQELLHSTVAVLYICKYNYTHNTMKVTGVIEFSNPGTALNAYSNIPNPESQLASGKDKESFEKELNALHKRLNNPKWVKELAEYL